MDKRQSVIESIQKLLALNVPDNEIADNLFDVGISKEEASELIREARGIGATQSQAPASAANNLGVQKTPTPQNVQKISKGDEKSSKAVFDETVTKLSMNDQVISQIPFVKQSSEKKVSKEEENFSEDVENNIIGDVASQSLDEDTQEDKVSENLNESKTTVSQSASAGEKKSITPNLNDEEESEDEFESRVHDALASAKKAPVQPIPQIQPEKISFNQSPSQSSSYQARPSPAPIPSYQNAPSFTKGNASPSQFQKTSADYSSYGYSQKSPSVSFESSPNFEELWKKGIVVAVNAKLAEMKQLKEDVDTEINQKVDEAVRKELYQFKVVNDSQKELLISSNKEALEAKQKEITFIIDSKIAEIKMYNKQLSETLKLMEDAKKQQENSVAEIKSVLEEAKKTKAQLLIEVNSEMIKTKSQAQAFLDSATTQLNQMDERVNKTLELEKNIAEGMLNQAEQKIEQLAITRADELIEKMEVELNKLQATNKKISPEVLDDKIKTIEKFRTEFINNMQSSLSQINAAIEELNRKNELAQSTLEEKTLAIDAKMEELTKFEKQFTQIMDNVLKKQ